MPGPCFEPRGFERIGEPDTKTLLWKPFTANAELPLCLDIGFQPIPVAGNGIGWRHEASKEGTRTAIRQTMPELI